MKKLVSLFFFCEAEKARRIAEAENIRSPKELKRKVPYREPDLLIGLVHRGQICLGFRPGKKLERSKSRLNDCEDLPDRTEFVGPKE